MCESTRGAAEKGMTHDHQTINVVGSILAGASVFMGSFRFDDGWILRRLNSNFIHVRMRQICPPSVLPMLQHAKGLTTVVVRTQRLVSYRRRSRPSCKSKAPYCSWARYIHVLNLNLLR